MSKSVFLISPVRNLTPEVEEQLAEIVRSAEDRCFIIHWPKRDTDQSGNGTAICQQNRQAIEESDEVWLWYDPNSQGSLFDIGIAWGLHKPMVLVGPIPEKTTNKSFNNVVLEWANDSTTDNG